jgi:hypothetical protein
MPVTTLLLGSGLALNVAATVPTYDIKPTCRAAIALSGASGRTVEMCEASEAQARSELVKDWSTFTEAAKVRCLQTSAWHAPSYVELLICLECPCATCRNAKSKRKRREGAANPANRQAR